MRQPLWPNPWGARGLNISGADSFEPLFDGKTLEASRRLVHLGSPNGGKTVIDATRQLVEHLK